MSRRSNDQDSKRLHLSKEEITEKRMRTTLMDLEGKWPYNQGSKRFHLSEQLKGNRNLMDLVRQMNLYINNTYRTFKLAKPELENEKFKLCLLDILLDMNSLLDMNRNLAIKGLLDLVHTYKDRQDILMMMLQYLMRNHHRLLERERLKIDPRRGDPIRSSLDFILNSYLPFCHHIASQVHQASLEEVKEYLVDRGFFRTTLKELGHIWHANWLPFSLFKKVKTKPRHSTILKFLYTTQPMGGISSEDYLELSSRLENIYDSMHAINMTDQQITKFLASLKSSVQHQGIHGMLREDSKQQIINLEAVLAHNSSLASQDRNTIDEIIETSQVHIPNYVFLRKLGERGSRRVYLAKEVVQGRVSSAPVKVKIFKTQQEDLSPKIRERYQRNDLEAIVLNEGDVLIQLHHPNVAAYHGRGVTPDGHLYLVSQYVDGGSLDKRLGQLSAKDLLKLFPKICEGLAYLHGKGFIHRDIKLDNILVNHDFSEVVIDDLETATKLGELLQDSHSTTMGSDNYAAPELYRGEKASIASDVYALGACLFYILTQKIGSLQEINRLPRDQYLARYIPFLTEQLNNSPPLLLSDSYDSHQRKIIYNSHQRQLIGSRQKQYLLKHILIPTLHYDPSRRFSSALVIEKCFNLESFVMHTHRSL